MLSKGDPIDWTEVETELRKHMQRTRGTFSHEQTFWHGKGGFEAFFTMINGRMYKNSFFDIPVTQADLEAREEPFTPDRVKIDWDSIHADWSDFWRHRGFGKDQLEGYEEFWNRLGGINRYFDTDDEGNRTRREYLLDIPKHTEERRPVPGADIMEMMERAGSYSDDVSKPLTGEDIGKVFDKVRGPLAESETRETYITKVTIDSSIRRHSLRLGKSPKVVFCKLTPLGNRLELWVERANDLDLGTITNFDFFREDEVIPSDYHHVFSFKRSLRRVSHFYMRVAD